MEDLRHGWRRLSQLPRNRSVAPGTRRLWNSTESEPYFFFFVKVYQKTLHAGGNDGVWAPWCATSYFIMKFVI